MNKENIILIKVFATSLIFFIVTMIIVTIMSNLFAPKVPTFRQRCEENNGIYIENFGRVGDSCIYDKGEYDEKKTN